MIILNCRGFYLRAVCLYDVVTSEVYLGPSRVFTTLLVVRIWQMQFSSGRLFFFLFLMHNIGYQQPLLFFKRLMLSTSFHFVPPLQSGIVCLVNFVDVKRSV